MLLVAVFLVVVPLWQNPVPQLVAFGGILLGIPVYVVFVMEKPVRIKPKLFNRISSEPLTSAKIQHEPFLAIRLFNYMCTFYLQGV